MKEEDSNILATYSKQELGTCILCDVKLQRIYDKAEEERNEKKPEYFALKCSKCHREYFPRYEMIKREERFGGIHDDVNELLETEGIGVIDDGGILISGEEDNRFFPKKDNPTDYLKRHFGGHVTISSEESISE